MKKMLKKFVTLVVMATILATMAVPTYAATKAPYWDTPKWYVGATTYKAIKYLKKHHTFDGVIKGNEFNPDMFVNTKVVIKYLRNTFGKKNVPITKADKKKYKKPVSNIWLKKKLNAIAKKIGGVAGKVPLAKINALANCEVATMIYSFCKLSKKNKPIR